MSYIGVQPTAGQYRQLDDISGSFNGATVTFTTSVGGLNVTAGSAEQLLVSLGGVIQNPGADYSVSTNSITFTTAPGSGLDFFAILMGDAVNVGTPADGSVTSVKLASDLTVDLASGTVSAPSLTFDANTGLYSPGADQVAVATNGVERVEFGTSEVVFNDGGEDIDFRIEGDTEANLFFVDAGNDSVSIGGDVTITDKIIHSGDTDTAIRFPAADTVSVEVAGGEAVRVDSSGRLLVGTSTARATASNGATPDIQVETTDNTAAVQLIANFTGAAGPTLFFGKARGNALGSNAVVADGDTLGAIIYSGADGTDLNSVGAQITAQVDGTPGSNDMPGRLVFATTADGASSPTERLRIDANGRLTQATDTYNFTTVDAANMSISSTGNIRRSTSSLRYKTDVETMEDAYADNILNARPVWYRSVCEDDNPSYGYWGFIAEEISQIDPRLCFYSQNENGDQQVDGVAYDRFVPHLLNLIKRQKEQIQAMEARLSALEAQ